MKNRHQYRKQILITLLATLLCANTITVTVSATEDNNLVTESMQEDSADVENDVHSTGITTTEKQVYSEPEIFEESNSNSSENSTVGKDEAASAPSAPQEIPEQTAESVNSASVIEQSSSNEEIRSSQTRATVTSAFGDSTNIAEGTVAINGSLKWWIDSGGCLYVAGNGEISSSNSYNRAPWYGYRDKIKSVDVSGYNAKSTKNLGYMLYGCSSLTSIEWGNFNTGNVTNMDSMFWGCSSLTSLDVNGFNTSNVTNMDSMFYGCHQLTELNLSNFNTGKATNMNRMFCGCAGLKALDVSGFDTSNVTDMGSMFDGCYHLTELDVRNFNTSNVTNMGQMFLGCKTQTLDLSGFDTSNVTYMGYMFSGCSQLTELDLSNFNTSKVTSMACMFNECFSLTSLNITSFDTVNVTSMMGMFQNCSNLTTLDLSGFDTRNVTDMGSMFWGNSGLLTLDVSGFDTSKATTMMSMFNGCSNLTSLNLSSFDVSSLSQEFGIYGIFDNCTKLSVIGIPKNLSQEYTLPNTTDELKWRDGAGTIYPTLPQKQNESFQIVLSAVATSSKITLDAGTGMFGDVTTLEATFDKDISLSKILNDSQYVPTKEGYAFKGWSTDGTTVLPDTTTLALGSTVTLTAVWEPINECSVVIPKTLILDGQTGTAEYQVTVKGQNTTLKLSVTPDSNFTMTSGDKTTTCTVIQDQTVWNAGDLTENGSTTSGKLNANLSSGSWIGKCNFNISFES